MLDVTLLPKQWEVFRPSPGVDADYRLYQGGVGSGKTFLGALKGLSVCHDHPGCTWLVVSDTYARLAISTLECYQELLCQSNIRYSYNKSDKILRIPQWGSRVIFKGMDDPTALRSVTGNGGHIEEASLLSEASYLAFLQRLRQGLGGVIEVLLTTNPQPIKGWLWKHFVDRAGVEALQNRKGDITRIGRRRVIARTADNPHLPEAFIAGLKSSYDARLYNIMVNGEDGDLGAGLVCSSWSDANVDDAIVYRPELPIYLTCDFNVDPMCWLLAHRVNNEYHYFDELCQENTTTIKAAEAFYRHYPDHTGRIIITGDASGQNRGTKAESALDTDYTILRARLSSLGYRQLDLDLPTQNPLIDNRISCWNGLVCNSQGVRRVKVNPKCKWLIWNCENLRYWEGTRDIRLPTRAEIQKDDTHTMKYTEHPFAAASYLTYRYDPLPIQVDRKPIVFESRPFVPTRR
jgi:PBSX family phage terminase large subunit